jgi:hypothetical protein
VDVNAYEKHVSIDANVSEKLFHLPTSLHGSKTQKNIIILTAVKTSNLTFLLCSVNRSRFSIWKMLTVAVILMPLKETGSHGVN